MRKGTIIIMAAVTAAAAYEKVSGVNTESAAPAGGNDAVVELTWHTGGVTDDYAYYEGADYWAGDDYDRATLTSYNWLQYVKMYYWPNWPNGTWEGNRVAVFNFSGGAPGGKVGGPWWVKGNGWGWNTFDISWGPLPNLFVVAWEQVYNYPDCDPIMPTGPGTDGHDWYYYGGIWRPWTSNPAWAHRTGLNDEQDAVAPQSLGRVKALFR